MRSSRCLNLSMLNSTILILPSNEARATFSSRPRTHFSQPISPPSGLRPVNQMSTRADTSGNWRNHFTLYGAGVLSQGLTPPYNPAEIPQRSTGDSIGSVWACEGASGLTSLFADGGHLVKRCDGGGRFTIHTESVVRIFNMVQCECVAT